MTWPSYSPACRKDVQTLLKRGGSLSAYRANREYGLGPARDSWAWRVERDIERRFGVRHAVAVNSGTAALHAALAALDLKGGEVVTSPFTFSATAAAILHSGGTPVFADVDPDTYSITKETVNGRITKRTKAVLPVHLFGRVGEVQGLESLGLPLVEDSCQAVGARRGAKHDGFHGFAAAYSFNGGKNVPAGEAGALVTNSDEVAYKARLLANHGENFASEAVGYNYRLNELSACVVWHGLQELEARNAQRIALAKRVTERLALKGVVTLPPDSFDGRHVFYVYPFKVKSERERIVRRLKQDGIAASGGYVTPPLHHYPAFQRYVKRPLPVVDDLSFQRLVILADLTPDKDLNYADYVADRIAEAVR